MITALIVALVAMVVAAVSLLLALSVGAASRRQAVEQDARGQITDGLRAQVEQGDRERAELESAVTRLESLIQSRMQPLEDDQQQLRLSLSAVETAARDAGMGVDRERAALTETSERLKLEHAELSQTLRAALAEEAASASRFRAETVEEVAELLRRHAEMLRTEMAAVGDGQE